MPARHHVTVRKPFDRYVIGQEVVLSERGFQKMTTQMPGYVDLRFIERDDGACTDPKGKEIEAPWETKEKADAKIEPSARDLVTALNRALHTAPQTR